MTIKDRIIDYLQQHLEGTDDDDLAAVLNLNTRQQSNSQCRQLEADGFVERRKVNGKIHNFWIGKKGGGKLKTVSGTIEASQAPASSKNNYWYWEGNVQAQVVRYLAGQEYDIMSVADTASHQRGKDIVARKNGLDMWVSVKGYPLGTKKTRPSIQAGHWFKKAVFDMLEYRGENIDVFLGLALPDFSRYRDMAQRISWLPPVVKYKYYWVQESGDVVVE